MWDWSIGSLEVALYRAGHRGWSLGARGRLFPERRLGSGLAPDHKQTKKIIKRFTTELFRRAPFADQTFADGHLPTDNFSTSYYKSPLDREERAVGPRQSEFM